MAGAKTSQKAMGPPTACTPCSRARETWEPGGWPLIGHGGLCGMTCRCGNWTDKQGKILPQTAARESEAIDVWVDM